VDFFASPYLAPVLGFLVGLIGSLVGMGGGFFIVPYLTLVHGFAPPLAIGTSLWLIVANSASSTLRYGLQRQVLWRLGVVLGVATLPGAYFGAAIAGHWDVGWFQICFGVLLAAACVYAVVLSGSPRLNEDPAQMRVQMGLAVVVSIVTGFVSSMFGVGGGIIHMPLMMFAFRMPARMSAATSQWALLMTSLAGAVSSTARGQTDWPMVLLLLAGVVMGAQVGVWAAKRVDVKVIRRAFAVICLVVAVEMFVKGLG